MLLANDIITQNFTYSYACAAHFNLNLNQLKSVLRVLDYARGEFLFEGPITSLTPKQLFFGYHTDIVGKLNTGSISQGNIYYDSLIQPVYLGNNVISD